MVFFPRSRYTSIRATYVKLIKEKGKNEKRSGQRGGGLTKGCHEAPRFMRVRYRAVLLGLVCAVARDERWRAGAKVKSGRRWKKSSEPKHACARWPRCMTTECQAHAG